MPRVSKRKVEHKVLPVFGNESQEVAALRELEKLLEQYIAEEASIEDIKAQLLKLYEIRHAKRDN